MIHEISNRKVSQLAAVAVVLFVILFLGWYDNKYFVYCYHFRLLNSPTLDKDFGQVFMVPMIAVVLFCFQHESVRQTKTQYTWILAFAMSLPMSVIVHSLITFYALATTTILAIACWIGRTRITIYYLVGVALLAALFMLTQLVTRVASYHE